MTKLKTATSVKMNAGIVGDPMPEKRLKNIDWDNTKDYEFNYEAGLRSDFDALIDKLPAIKQYIPCRRTLKKQITDVKKRFEKT
jgi:hypothetical protein